MKAVRAIIKESNKILIVHNLNMDLILLPGGKCNKNEDSESAIIREVKEETDLNIENHVYVTTGIWAGVSVDLFFVNKYNGVALNKEPEKIGIY
jgi:8-oxo-dGTP pyrophosphatase MutT (NUDIX family)